MTRWTAPGGCDTWRCVAFSLVVAAVAVIAPPLDSAAKAVDEQSDVVAWIDRHAVSLALPEVSSPTTGLEKLESIVEPATVVGLGEPTHGSHEQFAMKLSIVQFLVEHAGFRTVAFENDFATGLAIDRYVTTGAGDPVQLVSGMSSPFWATEEMVDLVRWLRSYNQTHTDPVRFFGADLLQLRQESFDAITAYVTRVAPERLEDLAADLDRIQLRGSPSRTLGLVSRSRRCRPAAAHRRRGTCQRERRPTPRPNRSSRASVRPPACPRHRRAGIATTTTRVCSARCAKCSSPTASNGGNG